MFFFSAVSCPHCHCPLEVRLMGLSSGLGPAEVNCLKCQQPFATSRSEWSEKTFRGKFLYAFVSLLYVALFGILVGAMVDQGVQTAHTRARDVRVRFDSTVFAVAACVGGLAVIPLQIYRIAASKRRSREGYKITPGDFFLGLQWNLHAKGLILLVFIWAFSMIKYG